MQGIVVGLLQTALATGQLSGAPLASLFISLGGYSLPYMVTGLLQCVMALLFLFTIPTFSDSTQNSNSAEPVWNVGTQTRIFKFFSCKGIVLTTTSAFSTSMFMGFLSAAFAPYLLDVFDIGQSESGIYFIPYSFSDAFSGLIFGKFVDAGYTGLVYSLGVSIHAVALLALSFPLFFPNFLNMFLLQVCLAVTGLCFQAIATPGFSVFKTIALANEIDSPGQVEIFCRYLFCFHMTPFKKNSEIFFFPLAHTLYFSTISIFNSNPCSCSLYGWKLSELHQSSQSIFDERSAPAL